MEAFCQIQAPGLFDEVYGSMLKQRNKLIILQWVRKVSTLHSLGVYSGQDLIQISIPKLTLQLRKHSKHGHSTLLIFNFFFKLSFLPPSCKPPPSYNTLGSACNIFEPRMATRSEHFAHKDCGVSQIFKLMVSTSEKKLNNINGIVWRQVK